MAGITYVFAHANGDWNWSDPSAWAPNGTPGSNDAVILKSGVLDVSAPFAVASLRVDQAAMLEINGAGNYAVAGNLTDAGDIFIGSTTDNAQVPTGKIAIRVAGELLLTNGNATLGRMRNVGNTYYEDTINAVRVVNDAELLLWGKSEIDASNGFTNNGAIAVSYDTETISCAVTGTGRFTLRGGTEFPQQTAVLQFGTSVSVEQKINERGPCELILDKAEDFHGRIGNFGGGEDWRDAVDAKDFSLSATNFTFAEGAGHNNFILTMTDGAKVAHILFADAGDPSKYSSDDFSIAPDNGKGTLIRFF